MNTPLQNAILDVSEVFTGSNGGMDYIKFRRMIESLETKALNGDAASKEILLIVERFCKLVELSKTKG
jgi:hypothetical protein